MPVREWTHRTGHIIHSYPQGTRVKYVVYLSDSHIIAGTTLAEVFTALDALAEVVCPS